MSKATQPSAWYSIRRRTATARAVAAAAGDAASSTSAEVLIFGDIGESWWGEYVSAKEFIEQINALDVADMTVRINSAGGSVPDGLAIYNALRRHPAHVTTVNEGMAMSIASLILMAGDTVEMAENSLLMIHAPWTYTAGNAVAMRETADMLDKWATAMAASYATKTGRPVDQVMGWLTDGADHYFTAAEAQTEKLIDNLVAAAPVAAMAQAHEAVEHYRALAAAKAAAGHLAIPAAPAASTSEIKPMPQALNPAGTQAPANDPAAIAAQALAADQTRRADIAAAFRPFAEREGVQALLDQCRDDVACSADSAGKKLLAHLASGATPLAGTYVHTVEDEQDKARKATTNALMARAGLAAHDSANPLRGSTLYDLARASLQRSGVNMAGMDKQAVVAAAFTHSTSDFTNLLANLANKAMLKGVEEADESFQLWTAEGVLTDFKPATRVGLNSFGSLPKVLEGGEYTLGTIGDRGNSIVLGKYGKLFNITREAIINDDLNAMAKIPRVMGRAAIRTVGDLVYAVLNSNPLMGEDGVALFDSATHKNLLTGSVISTAAVDAIRVAMARQKLPGQTSGSSNIRLSYLLVPMALEGLARTVRESEFEVGSATKNNTTPNTVRGTFEVVSDARLDDASATAWYGAANQNVADTIEVSYLDGNKLPTLEQQSGWTVDGVQMKVRMEAGVAPLDFRGMAKNPGA